MKSKTTLPELECACATARRAARLITQLYSQEMGDRLEPGQFAMLAALDQMPGCNQTTLGGALGLDRTTMSRNLGVLKRNRWIESAAPLMGYRLTAEGTRLLAETKPGWKRAQAKLRGGLQGEWDSAMKALDAAANAAAALCQA